jgi:hypothetical protein
MKALVPFSQFDNESQIVLDSLAEGLIPITAWIKEREKKPTFFKPESLEIPWRKNGKFDRLTPKDIGAVNFIEQLLREPSSSAELGARWHSLELEPLQKFPLADPTAWRTARGLEPEAEFGVIESENIFLDTEEKVLIRNQFYAEYLPILVEAAREEIKKKPIDWIVFSTELLENKSTSWKSEKSLKSSVFIKQFIKDLLYAMMGMRNQAPAEKRDDSPELWKHALLIEVGEHRRVGNKYIPDDVQKARDKLPARPKS